MGVAMFGFGYAMSPLYDLYCRVTGSNGKPVAAPGEQASARVDESRWVTVEFTGNTVNGLPWEFRPKVAQLRVHPGAATDMTYIARNNSSVTLVGRAVPSVAPGRAATHFKKTECFCFTNQPLAPGETKEMPVRFVVDTDLPADVRTVTLSYAFFDATGLAPVDPQKRAVGKLVASGS
jgi:cytochrome c oxidase assembly protein subunit 11